MEEEFFSDSELDLDELAQLEANLVILENTKAEKALQEKLQKEGVEVSTSVIEEELHPVIMYLVKTFPYLNAEEPLKFLKTRSNLNNISSFVEALDLVYPGSWSPQYVFQNEIANLFFVIKFPKVVITNSYDISHTITDLYVRIGVNGPNCNFNGAIQGVRGVLSTEELNYDGDTYEHSHLSTSRGTIGKYTTFCLGSSELASLTNKYAGRADITVEEATKFVLLIMSLVNWESLEGTPYRKIEYISRSNSRNNPFLNAFLTAFGGITCLRNRSYASIGSSYFRDLFSSTGLNYDLNNVVIFKGINSYNKLNFEFKPDYVNTLIDFVLTYPSTFSRTFLYFTNEFTYETSNTILACNYNPNHADDVYKAIEAAQERLLKDNYDNSSLQKDREVIKTDTEIYYNGEQIPVINENSIEDDSSNADLQKQADQQIASLELTIPMSIREHFEKYCTSYIQKLHLIKLKNYELSK